MLLSANDVSSGGFGQSWGHARSYNNQMSSDVDYGNGVNWLVYQWPNLIEDGDTIIVVRAGQNSEWYDLSGGSYVGRYGILSTLMFDGTYFTLASRGGTTEVFANFSSDEPGQLLQQVTPGGANVSLSYDGGQVAEMLRTYSDGGVTITESYLYTYLDGENAGHIANVMLRRQIGVGGPWYNVRKATYTYYASGDTDGLVNDLKTVTRWVPDGTDWTIDSTDYYRYYVDDAGGTGFAHGLKYVVGPEAYRRLTAATGNPFTASDAEVAQFADSYFEYDGLRRVTLEDVGGGARTFRYAYSISAFADGPNNWTHKTVETRPDGSLNIAYMNHIGQPMLQELTDGVKRWITYQQFDDNYDVIFIAAPSAINLSASPVYNESVPGLAVQLLTGAGLITTNEYYDGTTGVPAGYLKQVDIQQGTSGTPIVQQQLQYTSNTANGVTVYPVSQKTVYQDDAGAVPIITSFSYLFYSGTNQLLQKTTTLPVIPTGQNGSGVSATQQELYDLYGNMIWEQGPRGFIDYFTYDIVTGARTQMIEDVDPSLTTLPSGWSRPSGLPTPLNLVTDYTNDNQGRMTQSLGPVHDVDGVGVRTARWTVYLDAQHQTWSGQGYATGTPSDYAYTLVNPVAITINDLARRAIDTIAAARCSTSGPLDAGDCFDQASWTRWTRQTYDNAGQLISSQAYHTIPASGSGQAGVNYDETEFGYDAMGRKNRTVTPGGTISRSTFDVRGRTTGSYIGTDDYGATNTDPTGGSAPGNNMVIVTSNAYSSGCDCTQPTTVTNYVDANPANNRVTTVTLDFRNRVTTIAGELNTYQVRTYNNQNQVVQVDQYNGSGGNLIARSQSRFNPQGQVYQSLVFAVNPNTGAVGNALVTNNWYDEAGNQIKTLPAGSQLFTKTFRDSQARTYGVYKGYYTGSGTEPYSAVGQITSQNKIFEQTLSYYSGTDKRPIEVAVYQRNHNADSTGGALQPTSSGAQPWSRTIYLANYYDGVGRLGATANYGTNNNAAFIRPDAVPERSDSVLVVSYGYDPAGNRFQAIDPAGVETRQTFNALGKALSKIGNYTGGCPGNTTDVTVKMQYNADGNLVALTACNHTTGDQTTRYLYGVSPADGSTLTSNALLLATIYPDAVNGQDRVTQSYDRQGELIAKTDQNGTVHQYIIDKLGRQTADAIATLGSDIDGSIQRIGQAYDVRGLPYQITSYSDSAGTTVANQVQNAYNDFQQLVMQYQEHSGAVNTATTLSVDYSYADGSANTVRPTSLVYPNGRTTTYGYGTSGGDNDRISRVQNLADVASGVTLANYTYLGLSSFVQVNYPQPSVTYNLATGSGAAPYLGLDPFGRVVNCLWTNASSTTEQVLYGYNRLSSRIWRGCPLAASQSPPVYQDELYSYDPLQRLVDMSRGQLIDDNTQINGVSFAQNWQLDATGNWPEFRQWDTATPTNNLDQQRASNQANEIAAITQRFGAAWAQPGYDRAGNMTTIPNGNDPTVVMNGVYDAWNRLVAVAGVATYAYDGLNRRITITASGHIRHCYYTAQWQDIEERLDASTTPDRQFAWGLRYIDDLVLRDRSTTGTLNERLYTLQDANWNVTAVVNTSGVVQERYRYSPYGAPTFLNASFAPIALGGNYQWETLYCGYRWDLVTGIFAVRERYLQPFIGNWISRDPLGTPESELNLYLYGIDSPLNAIDPLGTTSSFTSFTFFDIESINWKRFGSDNPDIYLGSAYFDFDASCTPDGQVVFNSVPSPTTQAVPGTFWQADIVATVEGPYGISCGNNVGVASVFNVVATTSGRGARDAAARLGAFVGGVTGAAMGGGLPGAVVGGGIGAAGGFIAGSVVESFYADSKAARVQVNICCCCFAGQSQFNPSPQVNYQLVAVSKTEEVYANWSATEYSCGGSVPSGGPDQRI
ncbi:MAG: RHS repeat-associated core domain-containing protein [Planctomycetes bacterium]|nr:RHS repeat-associated core domain-containing protein [Planctomycetota bacterium]